MQRLRRILRWRAADDAGAVTVVVALMISGVLLGMGALVIDVGALYTERRELQNGADFATLSVAGLCAKDVVPGVCATSAGSTAQTYADGNAKDAKATVDGICGSAPGLTPCTGGKLGPWDCSATRPALPYVQVRTSTKTAGGGTLLPPILSRTLAGNGGDSGHQVRACARAAYGALGSYNGLALTVSRCEWDSATANGTVFAPPPPYPVPLLLLPYERVLKIHTTAGEPTCGAGPPGFDLPGGFGWLDDTGAADCQTTVDAGGIYDDKTGVGTPSACKNALLAAWTSRSVIYLPIYDGVTGVGGNGTYHLAGFAAFVVTGYQLPGAKKKSWITGNDYCSGADKCIYGFFTKALISGEELNLTGTNFGLTTTQLMP